MLVRTGLGQDSHRFIDPDTSKPLILGGVIFEDTPGLSANSDGDVVLHAICNAITSLTHTLVLGGIADEICFNKGITDSQVYVEEALKLLEKQKITHISISIECRKPKIKNKTLAMRQNISKIMQLEESQVGITATTGEGLTSFGRGDGIQCLCIITTMEQ
jgi:2-C-methyl-D-erythritol 2,4-cyclodiphosphate synthase